MQKERDVELARRVEDRPEGLVRQIRSLHVGGHVPADEVVLADAAPQLRRRGDGVLHGQKRPSQKAPGLRGRELGETVVAKPRRLARELWIEIVVDQRRGERNDGAVDAELLHARELPRRLEERRVQAVMHAAHREIDALAVRRRHAGVEFRASLDEFEQAIRNEMTVDVGDHVHSPR
jgi:hypothetical protein